MPLVSYTDIMKIYFIVPKESFLPTSDQMEAIKAMADVESFIHVGKLSELPSLIADDSQKIIAVDPDSFSWNLDVETLDKIPNVVAVCPSTTSFDWIGPDTLEESGIIGTNVPGFSADSVAEYVIAMAIDVSRRLPLVIKNGWDKGNDNSFLLKGRKIGVVGLGRIGGKVAELAHGIGMDVYYHSPNSSDDRFNKVSLEELFKQADVIVPTLVENEVTRGLITHEVLDSMKKDSVLVGINRVKDIWDEDYVLEKVKKGELRGYAFEGDNAKSLTEYEGNVWALPPMAWATEDSLNTLMQTWVDTILSVIEGEPINVITK